MTSIFYRVLLAILLIMSNAVVSAQDKLDTRTAFVCNLTPLDQLHGKHWNFGILLDSIAGPPNHPSVPVLATVDSIGALSGAKIVRFHDNGNGYFAGLTGPLRNENTLMLSLSKNSDKSWFDAGIAHLVGDKKIIFGGMCVGVRTKDTTSEFYDVMSENRKSQ